MEGAGRDNALSLGAGFVLCPPTLHHLFDALCKLGAGPEPLDENGAALEEKVLCRRGEFGKVSGHGGIFRSKRRAGQLPLNILYGEPHRHHAGFIPGALFALHYSSRFIQYVTHTTTFFELLVAHRGFTLKRAIGLFYVRFSTFVSKPHAPVLNVLYHIVLSWFPRMICRYILCWSSMMQVS